MEHNKNVKAESGVKSVNHENLTVSTIGFFFAFLLCHAVLITWNGTMRNLVLSGRPATNMIRLGETA